jgi:hypothetical protein
VGGVFAAFWFMAEDSFLSGWKVRLRLDEKEVTEVIQLGQASRVQASSKNWHNRNL